MFRFFENWTDPFRRHDESMPPPTLLAFYWRYTRQVWPGLAALLVAGLIVALIEVAMYNYLGSIVDLLQTTSPADLLSDHGGTFLWMAFVIVLARPGGWWRRDRTVSCCATTASTRRFGSTSRAAFSASMLRRDGIAICPPVNHVTAKPGADG